MCAPVFLESEERSRDFSREKYPWARANALPSAVVEDHQGNFPALQQRAWQGHEVLQDIRDTCVWKIEWSRFVTAGMELLQYDVGSTGFDD